VPVVELELGLSLPERLARAEPGLVATLIAAAQRGEWRPAAWLLERAWPERWGHPSQRATNGSRGPDPDDPFAEVDELARRRQWRPVT
jgi:hypothetical protein